jgi:integrase
MNCSPSWRAYDYADIEPSARAMHKGFQPEVGIIRRSALWRLCRCRHNRHTAATLLLTQNVHPKVVQERLGHAQIHITLDTYSHVLPSMQKDATARLDRLLAKAVK